MAPAENAPENRKRVLSGMRPTGRLHIGHYFGALQNWIRLQNDPQYECFYFIADWHALTTDYADTSFVAQNTIEIATDWLAAGLDPEKCTFFVQSSVPEHAELYLLLNMITPLGWLERVPTYKEALENITNKDLHTYGFLGYPFCKRPTSSCTATPKPNSSSPSAKTRPPTSNSAAKSSADLMLFMASICGTWTSSTTEQVGQKWLMYLAAFGDTIPDRRGQSPEEFLTEYEQNIRRIAIQMGVQNFIEKTKTERSGYLRPYFSLEQKLREPEVMLTHTPRIPGLDGRKMSKSYGNAIMLSESDDDIRKKTKVMVTDPARKRRTDPGNPDVCPVFDWHKLFSPPETQAWAAQGCRTAGIGCIECKAAMAENLIKWIEPVRQRRLDFERDPRQVLEYLDTGSTRARMVAQQTMDRVREAVFHWSEKRAEITGGRGAH